MMRNKSCMQPYKVWKSAALSLLVFVALARVCVSEPNSDEHKQARSQFVWFPLVFSSPETGFGAGATFVLTARKDEDSKPDSLSAVGFYTQEQQYLFAVTPAFYTGAGAIKFAATGAHSYFPSKFYGTGSETSESREEEYTIRTWKLKPSALFRIESGLRIGPFLDLKRSDIVELQDDGVLAAREYPGASDHVLSGGGLVAELDTRDNIFYPTRGSFHSFSAGIYRDWMGSDYEYEAYELDLRNYTQVGPDQVLALQFQANTVHGEVPFEEYPTLQNMRGIENARYRDLNSFTLQAEYRAPIAREWIGAVFASTGDVLENAGDWRPSSQKVAGGLGVRYTLNQEEKINFRFDLGFAEDGAKVYFRLMEAF